ncbi:MAG: hypothetical protein R2730_05745 [Chitinophagales bacterium]
MQSILPFSINEHYELYEFQLDPYEDLGRLDKYKYVGSEYQKILDYPVEEIILGYNLDFLRVAEATLDTQEINAATGNRILMKIILFDEGYGEFI